MGHPPDEVWRMTPKRIDAMMFVARKRVNKQRLEELAVALHAKTDDQKAVTKFVKELNS